MAYESLIPNVYMRTCIVGSAQCSGYVVYGSGAIAVI